MNETGQPFNEHKGLLDSIREINRKYRTPRIQMTRMVSISLMALRIYLIAILLILFYKFATLIVH